MERRAYYNILESIQKGDHDITRSGCPNKADFWKNMPADGSTAASALCSTACWTASVVISPIPNGSIQKCSADTAFCEITDLVEQGILQKAPVGAGARATRSLIDAEY